MKAILTGGSVVVHGDGQQSRDFIYVSDVVAGLISAATASNVNRLVLNVGSGQETTINELITQIEYAAGQRARLIRNREKSGGVRRLVADITQAQALLGFQPRVTLTEGLGLMLAEDPRFEPTLLGSATGD
jgi:UDP-glucose 4-epimerase